jgi:hypothetical protein
LEGSTSKEREINNTITSLAPYLGRLPTKELSNSLGKRLKCIATIKKRKNWQSHGVRNNEEGYLYDTLVQQLRHIREDGKFDKWNEAIATYQGKQSKEPSPELDLLLPQERELCIENGIDLQLYIALKDLLIREYTIFESLGKDALPILGLGYAREIQITYDFLLRNGWIGE